MHNAAMQYKNENTLYFLKKLGEVIKEKRLAKKVKSRHNFCNSCELDLSNLRRIEGGEIEPKITMLLRIVEALDIPLSKLIEDVEKKAGEDFHIIEP